jgi:hypothetical protein
VPSLASVSGRVQPLAVTARVIMLALVAALTLIATKDPAQLRWIALLLVAALPAFFAADHRVLAPLGRFAEVVVTCLAAGSVAAASHARGIVDEGFGAEAVLPYLIVPLLTAALRRKPTEGVALLGVAAVALVVGGTLTGDPLPITQIGYLAAGGQWLISGAIVTFAADTMRQFMQPPEPTPQP